MKLPEEGEIVCILEKKRLEDGDKGAAQHKFYRPLERWQRNAKLSLMFSCHEFVQCMFSILKVISMSGDRLLQWTSPLLQSSENGAKKMEVLDFRRSRDSGNH